MTRRLCSLEAVGSIRVLSGVADERDDVARVAALVFDLAAIRLVAGVVAGGVALDGAEEAPGVDLRGGEADVVCDAVVIPVEEHDHPREHVRRADEKEPVAPGARVVDDERTEGVLRAAHEALGVAGLRAVGDEHGAPRLPVHAVPGAELVAVARLLGVVQVRLRLGQHALAQRLWCLRLREAVRAPLLVCRRQVLRLELDAGRGGCRRRSRRSRRGGSRASISRRRRRPMSARRRCRAARPCRTRRRGCPPLAGASVFP